MKNILVICGPTASGKTSLALSIARYIVSSSSLRGAKRRGNLTQSASVNILSADSRQIYRGLDIVTGKDIPQNLPQSIKFFGLNLVNPSEMFNLSDYISYAHQVIEDSLYQNTPLIIVGGTGLYLKAITSNLLNIHVPPDDKLRKKLEKMDLPALKKKLLEINPKKFSSLNNSDANNPRRLIRAIEISLSLRGGTPTVYPGKQAGWQSHSTLSPAHGGAIQISPPTFHWVGISQDKVIQKEQIRSRVIARLESGAIEEVQTIAKNYPKKTLQLFSSLGVKQILEYLNNTITREGLIEKWTAAEVDYARRQMVWFKKQSGIIWYDKEEIKQDLVAKLANIFK